MVIALIPLIVGIITHINQTIIAILPLTIGTVITISLG